MRAKLSRLASRIARPKRLLVVTFQLGTICACLAQAPQDWKHVSNAKEIAGGESPIRQLGVWRTHDDQVTVQVLEIAPIKSAQGVWNVVGGMVYGLTKADQAPTSSAVISDTPHVCFRLSGKGKQENGAVGALDTYLVVAESTTYMVKVFSTTTTSAFSIAAWDFGTPIRDNREELFHALLQIKDRLNRNVSLAKASQSPSSEKEIWESARNASDDELHGDLRVWTSVVDDVTEHAINAAKKAGKSPPDMDSELGGLYRRLANNKFFNLDREERLHPGYQHELAQIAVLRGEKYSGDDPEYRIGYALARYGIPLAGLMFLISRWTRRVSRRTRFEVDSSRYHYCLKLLLKMSWRVALLIVLLFIVVAGVHSLPLYSPKEFAYALALTLFLCVFFLPPAVLLTSWLNTKRQFGRLERALLKCEDPNDNTAAQSEMNPLSPAANAWTRPESLGAMGPEGGADAVVSGRKGKTLKHPAGSAWWKRLFTVLEIAVFLLSVVIVALRLGEPPLLASVLILFLPVLLAHLVRIAVIYVVEGKKPFSRYD